MYLNNDRRFKFFPTLIYIITGIIVGLLAGRMIIVPAEMKGPSMKPELKSGDRLFFLKFGQPEKGKIVLIRSPFNPDKIYISRIVGTEGDKIEYRNGFCYINGEMLKAYTKSPSLPETKKLSMDISRRDFMPPVRLKRNEFFLQGDNPMESFDSRYYGPVTEESIIGILIYSLK